MEWVSGFDVPSMDSGFDWQGALRTAGQAVGGFVSTAGSLYVASQNLKTQREVNANNLRRSQLSNELEMVKAAGAVDIARAQVAGHVARERAAAAGLTMVSSPAGLSLGTVALFVGGFLILQKYMK